MRQSAGLFSITSAIALANAVIHVAGAASAGFAGAAMPALVGGVLWLVFALLFRFRQRWSAYPAFLLALFGGILVYAHLGASGVVPDWALSGILILDVLTAVLLFLLLWRHPAAGQAA